MQEALVEDIDHKQPGMITGRLSNNLMVHFEGPKELVGSIVTVRLKEAKGFYYIGEMI